MFYYLLMFIASIAFILLAFNNKTDKKKYYLFLLAGILIPSFFAALRGMSVGTDTYMYAVEFFEPAINATSFKHYQEILSTLRYGSIEIAYVWLNYVVAKLTGNAQVLLFIYSFLTNLFVYLGLNSIFNRKSQITLGWLIYFCALYCFSLNIMRQQLAGALLFYGVTQLMKGKYISYFVCLVFAFLSHNSAILGFVFLPIHEIIRFFKTKEYSSKIWVLLIGGSILTVLFFPVIVKLMVAIGLLGERYLVYAGSGVPIAPNTLLKRLPIIILMIVYGKRFNEHKEINLELMFILFFEILLSQLSIVVKFAYRITIYFTHFWVLALPQFSEVANKKERTLIYILVGLYMIAYWLLNFVILKGEAVVPFHFI